MRHRGPLHLVVCLLLGLFPALAAAQTPPLSDEDVAAAAADYARYCSLCHGDDRQGYVNDHAPSLRTKSLLATGNDLFVFRAIAYGRPGTAMSAYREESGGPMSNHDITRLATWLFQQVGADPLYDENGNEARLPYIRIGGDAELGAGVYARECAVCHGANGEGGTGTALFNQVMLVFASDALLKKTIEQGRENTPMPAFKGRLSDAEINGVTAYLRSHATGAAITQPVAVAPPQPSEYVLNPDGEDPAFDLKDGLYVSAVDLDAAINAKRRMVLLDTRPTSWWRMGHIDGAAPIPYYSDFDKVIDDLPHDVWIVGYCQCPRAEAEAAIKQLRQRGFMKTAVLWEGIQGWAALGFPIILGEVEPADAGE